MDNLSKEIIKRIISNLGFFPNCKKNYGLFSDDLKLNKQLKILDENKSVLLLDIFSGYLNDVSITAINFGNISTPDIVLLIQNSSGQVGLCYDWKNEEGLFLTKQDEAWHGLTLVQKLSLLIPIEQLTETGMLFSPQTNERINEIYEKFAAFVEFVENKKDTD